MESQESCLPGVLSLPARGRAGSSKLVLVGGQLVGLAVEGESQVHLLHSGGANLSPEVGKGLILEM